MKLPSTRSHGMLDYLTVDGLLVLPALLKPGQGVTRLMRGAAIGTALYSQMTGYDLDAMRVLLVKMQLALDALSGATFATAPLTFAGERGDTRAVRLGMGLFDLFAASSTEPVSSLERLL